jgi:hypothetical protein
VWTYPKKKKGKAQVLDLLLIQATNEPKIRSLANLGSYPLVANETIFITKTLENWGETI